MDLGIAVEIIGTLGFPIALAIAMCWMFYKVFTWQREDAKEREGRDRETIERFSKIVSVNSQALLKNSEVMDKINSNIDGISEDVHKLQEDVTLIKVRQEETKNK